jgi:hypothetical protein
MKGRSIADHWGMRRVAVILFLLVALVPTAAGAATRADTWTTHHSPGLSVAAPSTWVDVTRLTPQVLEKARELPSLKPYIDAVKRSKAVKLLLVDVGRTTVIDNYATNLNIVQLASGAADLQLVHDATVAQLRSSGAVVGALDAHYVTLPAGRAVELRYQAQFGSSPLVSLLQFAFVHAGTETVVTYTSLPKRAAGNMPTYLRSIRSLRWG